MRNVYFVLDSGKRFQVTREVHRIQSIKAELRGHIMQQFMKAFAAKHGCESWHEVVIKGCDGFRTKLQLDRDNVRYFSPDLNWWSGLTTNQKNEWIQYNEDKGYREQFEDIQEGEGLIEIDQ